MGLFIIPSGKLTVCHGKSPSLIDKSANYMGHGFNRKLKQITRGYVMWLFGKTWSVPMCEHPNSWQKDVHILDVETNILAFIHLMTHKYIQYIYMSYPCVMWQIVHPPLQKMGSRKSHPFSHAQPLCTGARIGGQKQNRIPMVLPSGKLTVGPWKSPIFNGN